MRIPRACGALLFSFLLGSTHVRADSSSVLHYLVIGGQEENSLDEIELRGESELDWELLPTLAFLSRGAPPMERHFVYGANHSYYANKFPRFFSQERRDGTAAQIMDLIQSYEDRIRDGSIKVGDRILIQIIGYGRKGRKNEQKTHSISVLASSQAPPDTFNLDTLIELTELTQQNGILVGVIDGSCYSGSSIALANPTTCVIAGSTSEAKAYASFTSNIPKKLKAGVTLEDLYLESRWTYEGLGGSQAFVDGNPQISTAAGRAVEERLKPLRGYLDYEYTSDLPDLAPLFESLERERIIDPKLLKSLKTATDAHLLLHNQLIKNRRKRASIQEKILTDISSPSLQKWLARIKRLDAEYQELEMKSRRGLISELEKKLYALLYARHASELNQPNPCRAFTL